MEFFNARQGNSNDAGNPWQEIANAYVRHMADGGKRVSAVEIRAVSSDSLVRCIRDSMTHGFSHSSMKWYQGAELEDETIAVAFLYDEESERYTAYVCSECGIASLLH
jgi:hypothetical protein